MHFSNMNIQQLDFRVMQSRPLSPSEGYENLVAITIDIKSDRSTPVYPPVLINISLHSSSPRYIFQQLVMEQETQDTNHLRLLAYLAEQISTAATSLGFGHNGFVMEIDYKVVYVVVRSDHPPRDESLSSRASLLRLVLSGGVRYREETKGLKMETEPCSICLDNLVVSGRSNSKRGIPTRMTCSHVFHDGCLLEWLQRKNTCPLCRTVLYDRSTILNNVD
ncbi:E3 ubiquitin-protein ligase SDIR1-like [Brassica rapa]|nr:E3 ubiquitin-protein ligase SDIR1-like [Brassica rapa]